MFLTKYKPEFPYKGNQVIISSDRVLLHSKNDSIFLFGKTAVSISTPGTFNIDANQNVIISAPTIQLGLNAQTTGEPVVKAKALITQLEILLDSLQDLSDALAGLKSERSGLAAVVVKIVKAAEVLTPKITQIKGQLKTIKSTVTFTN